MILKYEVKEEAKVVDILKRKLNISARLLIKLKNAKAIEFNNKPIYVNEIVKHGVITVHLEKVDLEEEEKIKEYLNLDINTSKLNIILEDEYILCINKPSGMPVHPSCIHQGNTLLEIASKYMYENEFKGKLHIVNRLDKETSGVVILAKHSYIQECISRQMQENLTDKRYIAIVDGILSGNSTIEASIARKEGSIIERCVNINGEYAKTKYNVIKINNENKYTVLDVKIYTGRTHQIRVHMQSIGHSLLGDGLYNENSNKYEYINRVALHARSLEFIHPISKKVTLIVAKSPKDIEYLMNL